MMVLSPKRIGSLSRFSSLSLRWRISQIGEVFRHQVQKKSLSPLPEVRSTRFMRFPNWPKTA
jgi:hypothetical protein